SPHKIRKMKLVNTITQADVLHQELWHTKVAPGTEEGIVAGFDLKKPLGDSLIFNGERTGNQSNQTEIICQGKKWQVVGDIVLSFPPPDSLPNSHYNGEEYQMYCQPNKWQDALEFLVAEEAPPANVCILGKVTLDDSYEPTGARVQELYAINEEYEPKIRMEIYKTGHRFIKYFPVHSYANKTDFEAWVRIAQPIKEAIDTKLQQSLYAEVEFREHRYPFRVSLFGYLAFADLSSGVLANMYGKFIPQSAKRISTGIYRSADRLNTYQLTASNISADLSDDTGLNLINPPMISNIENSDIMHFLGIFASYFI
uniref:hypothetical protein n=1 Tax=uncultured Microscilla sp. TaxID=432653 RepID=UPI00262F3872